MKLTTTSNTSSLIEKYPRLEKLGNALVYSHVWIALGATVQVIISAQLALGEIAHASVLYAAMIFCASVSFYSFHRIYSLWKSLPYLQERRFKAIYNLQRLLFTLIPLGAIGAGIFFLFLPFAWQWRAACPALISAAYVLPALQGKRLRDFGGSKVVQLSVGWVWLCSAVPYGVSEEIDFVFLFERFCFLLAITLPFDYRDEDHDAAEQVITWPQRLGRKNTALVSICCLTISAALSYFLSTTTESNHTLFLVLSAISVLGIPLVFLGFRQNKLHHLYYGLVLDALLIFPLSYYLF